MTSSPDPAARARAVTAGAAARPALAWAVPDLDPHAARGDAPTGVITVAGWMPYELEAARRAPPPSPLEEAYARGWDEGARDGLARAGDDLAPTAAMLEHVVSALADSADAFARDRERDLEALALAVARRLVVRELSAGPELVRGLIVKALELLPLDAEIVLRVNPDDLDRLNAVRADVLPEGRAVTLRWIADPAIERGSFVAETPQRMVDGRTDIALRALYERLGE